MEKKTVLITGARAPAALEWACQFHAAGWRVLAADSMPRPLASWSRAVERTWRVAAPRQEPAAFLEDVARICREEGVALVMPVCEEIFVLARLRERLPPGTELWADSFVRLRELHDKAAFMELAESLGLPVPETRRVTSREEVSGLSGDWFLKPCYSRFAVAGRRWLTDSGGEAEDRAWLENQVIGEARPWVAQEFLAGPGWCSFSLAEGGRVRAHASYPVEWTAGAGACVSFRAVAHPGIADWVKRFVEGTGFTGQIAFDFIDVPGRGVLPLECNPRTTSGLHLLPRAAALWDGEQGPGVMEPDKECAAQLTVPMLLYGLPRAVGRGEAEAWLRQFRAAREATWKPGDPAPAWLGNAWMLGWLTWQARRLHCSVAEASTHDLEWNGPWEQSSSPV